MRYVVIDPGHGGPDSGAVGPTGLREADVAMTLAWYTMATLLRDQRLDATPVLTRCGDTGLTLTARADTANVLHAKPGCEVVAFLSIHCNAHHNEAAEGFEVWTAPGWSEADTLATGIWSAMRRDFPTRRPRLDMSDGDPDKEARFAVLVKTVMPAVLVEAGFISNHVEEALLRDDAWLHAMGDCLAGAVAEFCDMEPGP